MLSHLIKTFQFTGAQNVDAPERNVNFSKLLLGSRDQGKRKHILQVSEAGKIKLAIYNLRLSVSSQCEVLQPRAGTPSNTWQFAIYAAVRKLVTYKLWQCP